MPPPHTTSALSLARLAALAFGLLLAGFAIVSSSRTAFPAVTPARIASVAVAEPLAVLDSRSIPRIGSRALPEAEDEAER